MKQLKYDANRKNLIVNRNDLNDKVKNRKMTQGTRYMKKYSNEKNPFFLTVENDIKEKIVPKKSLEEIYSSMAGNNILQAISKGIYKKNEDYKYKHDTQFDQSRDIDQYFNSSFHSLIQLDEKLCIKTFTKSIKNQINVRESDVGRPISDLTNTIVNIDLVQEAKTVLKTNKTLYVQAESDTGKWYSMLVEPIEKGVKREGVNVSFHDITKLTLSKKQTENENERLLRINMDHENFIYSVSHDLKSPLNSMESLVTLINKSEDIKSIKELTNPLLKSVKGLKQTISELSNITNLEKELEGSKSVELIPLLNEIKWSLRDLLKDSHAVVNTDFKVKEISFYRKNLRSILYNLLCNSIKYKSNNRQLKITLRTRKETDFVVLSISDNGIGISEEQLESIFSKFKRVSAGENIEGSGIGLFLVKRIVSIAKGEIKVQSELGKGTTFEIYFPIKQPSI